MLSMRQLGARTSARQAVLALSLALAASACSDEVKSPAPAPAPVAVEPAVEPAKPRVAPAGLPDANARPEKGDPNLIQLFRDDGLDKKTSYTLPVIPFRELSDGLPTSGTWRGYPLLSDFNGDGRADLIASNREEDGYSAWEAPKDGGWILRNEGLPRDLSYGPSIAADMNSDSIPDLVLSSHTYVLRVYDNDGKLNWKLNEAPIKSPQLIIDIASGNLDGDAFVDIASIGQFKGGIMLFAGDGKGGLRFRPESVKLVPPEAFGLDVEVGDLDGDGTDDVVSTTNFGLRAFLVRRGEPLTFEERSAGLPNPKIGNSLTAVQIARLAGDGPPRILVARRADPSEKLETRDNLGVYGWNAETKAWSHVDEGLPRNQSFNHMRAGDLDGNGTLDLVTIGKEGGASIHLGDGRGAFKSVGRLEGIDGYGYVALGDVDADGDLDIVTSVPATKNTPEAGGVRCFLNDASLWPKN